MMALGNVIVSTSRFFLVCAVHAKMHVVLTSKCELSFIFCNTVLYVKPLSKLVMVHVHDRMNLLWAGTLYVGQSTVVRKHNHNQPLDPTFFIHFPISSTFDIVVKMYLCCIHFCFYDSES